MIQIGIIWMSKLIKKRVRGRMLTKINTDNWQRIHFPEQKSQVTNMLENLHFSVNISHLQHADGNGTKTNE